MRWPAFENIPETRLGGTTCDAKRVDSYRSTSMPAGRAGQVTLDANGEGDWPLPPGEYDADYLLDDGYSSLAVAQFTVTP